jgi:hypothetical protein
MTGTPGLALIALVVHELRPAEHIEVDRDLVEEQHLC